MNARAALVLAALFLFVGVGAGAVGAHAFRATIAPELQPVYATAVQYHLVHALGLFGVGILLLHRQGSRLLAATAWLLTAGIVLFSGSLYFIALTGDHAPRALTPIGGVAFLVGWATLCVAAWRS